MGMDFDVLSKGAEEGDSASATAQEKKPEAKKEEEKSRGEEPMDTGDGRERTPEGDQQKVRPLLYCPVLHPNSYLYTIKASMIVYYVKLDPNGEKTHSGILLRFCFQAKAEKELGNEAYKKKDFENALLHYGNAIEIDPRDITYRNNRAGVQLHYCSSI